MRVRFVIGLLFIAREIANSTHCQPGLPATFSYREFDNQPIQAERSDGLTGFKSVTLSRRCVNVNEQMVTAS